MCGLAGILHLDGAPASPVLLRQMTDMVAHRGPDGEGHFIDGAVGLGHRRLAIIDLSPAGHQPMTTVDGRFVLIYNGEIYNFCEMRAELETAGWAFHSRTDSEVLLKAFAAWGVRALDRLNGMFAFAVWDRKEKVLTLARDRYGIKPLYYTLHDNTFLFGSEVKALLAHSAFPCAIDLSGLIEYFTFQNFFTNRTLFKDVRMLPAGTYMTVRFGQGGISQTRYWDFDFTEPKHPHDDTEYLEQLDRLFVQAVGRQLVSDVDVGAYLSGGMDSGAITAIAASQLPYMKSFTCGFDLSSASGMELSFDERSIAEHMSYRFKTEHYEMVLKAGDMERIFSRLAWHLEEPRVGQSYPNFYIAQLASKFVKVVLSGTGGDELFGGYPWRYYQALENQNFDEYIDKYYHYWQRLVPDRHQAQFFRPIHDSVQDVSTYDIFRDTLSQTRQEICHREDYVNHSLYLEAKTFLHGLLVVEDKFAMASSMEARVPFLDNDLVDFAINIPSRLKLQRLGSTERLDENEASNKRVKYYQRTRDGKLLLRRMMSRYVPNEVTEREKQGFSAPDASWFRGDSINYVREKIFTKKARIYEFLDWEFVSSLVLDHLEGRENRRLLIWSLLSFENWCEQFLSGKRHSGSLLTARPLPV